MEGSKAGRVIIIKNNPIMQSNEEKISPKCVLRGLIELSTMSHGSTLLLKGVKCCFVFSAHHKEAVCNCQ